MTSNPSSRRARAMIFAPRSWPSRPGLATRMRSFREGSAMGCGNLSDAPEARKLPEALRLQYKVGHEKRRRQGPALLEARLNRLQEGAGVSRAQRFRRRSHAAEPHQGTA